jgi:hypothetical protein
MIYLDFLNARERYSRLSLSEMDGTPVLGDLFLESPLLTLGRPRRKSHENAYFLRINNDNLQEIQARTS